MLPTLFWQQIRKNASVSRMFKSTSFSRPFAIQTSKQPDSFQYYAELAKQVPSPEDIKNDFSEISDYAINIPRYLILDKKQPYFKYNLKSLITSCFANFEYFKRLVLEGYNKERLTSLLSYGLMGYQTLLENVSDASIKKEVISRLNDMKHFLQCIATEDSKKIKSTIKEIDDLLCEYEFTSSKTRDELTPLR